MPKALMMEVLRHNVVFGDPSQVEMEVMFRLLGHTEDLGTIDTAVTFDGTDSPANISDTIRNAIVARAAEFGVTLTTDDIIPVVFSSPTSLVSALNSSTLTLTDDGVNQILLGSLGIVQADSPWRFDRLTGGGKLGVGRDPASGVAIRARVGATSPVSVDTLTEIMGAGIGAGIYNFVQTFEGVTDTGAMLGARNEIVARGTGKTIDSSVGYDVLFSPTSTDATTVMTNFRGFYVPLSTGGSTLSLTNFLCFDAEAQTSYGTNVWGIRTGNKAEFSSPSTKAETVLLLRQLSTGTGGGAHINFDSKAGDATTPTAGDLWRNATKLKFYDGTTTYELNPRTILIKVADETVTNNTLQDDDTLQFATLANTQYMIRLRVWFDTVAAADFKYQVTHSGTTTRVRRYIERAAAGGTSAATPTVAIVTAFDSADVSLTGTGTTGGFVREDIVLQVGASGGTFKFQWAQNTTDAAGTSVLEGSYLEYATT